jgi:hypothetical protein
VKKSKIKRLVSKKRAEQFAARNTRGAEGWRALVETEVADVVTRMAAKGYELVACLDTGEGVFVREQAVVGLHIQLPEPLYRRLDSVCRLREVSKRSVVVEALEAHLKEFGTQDSE